MTQVPDWLQNFFTDTNKIDLGKILRKEYPQEYQEMMAPLITAAVNHNWPVVLPLNDEQGLWFYATAQDERMLQELKRVLSASLGSADTHPEFLVTKQSINKSETALLEHAPAGFVKFRMLELVKGDLAAQKRVFGALNKLLSIYAQRPDLALVVRRPVGRILRDFFTACQANDGLSAEELYLELKNCGSLSQRNLLFLQFQALEAGRHWDRIIAHEKLGYCLSGRIPLKLKLLLLRAIGQTHFSQIHQDGFSTEMLEHVREICLDFRPLFELVPLVGELQDITDEWKTWAIGAAAFRCGGIEQCSPECIETEWLDKLFIWAGIERLSDLPTQESQFDVKQGEQPLDLRRVKKLLQHTLVASQDETSEIVVTLTDLPIEIKEQLKEFPVLHKHWESLQQEFQASNCGWSQWFTDLTKHDANISVLCQQVVNDCQYWSTSSFEDMEIQHIIESGNGTKVAEVLRDITPVMLKWIEDRGITCQSTFWVKALELLALDDVVSTQDVRLASLLVEKLLSKSYGLDEYGEALQAIEILLDKVNSIKSYNITLELMDLILENPCPDQKVQVSLWMAVQSFAIQKWKRISPLEKQLTMYFSQEILGEEAEFAFPDEQESGESDEDTNEQFPDLSGKKLAIYSLTEGAARRAKDMLGKMFNGLVIDLNNDHVATSALQNLAKKAEYFVFAANSAKHQAFYTVSKIRSDLIYPEGKGASSIVRSFVTSILK